MIPKKMDNTEVFNAPNVKAPRFRVGYEIPRLADFRKQYPEYKNMSKKQMNDILRMFGEMIWEGVINHRDGIDLPERMGVIFVTAIKVKKPTIVNYALSAKCGKKIYSNNLKTDGHIAKISFNNADARYNYVFKDFWGFTGNKKFKTSVSSVFPEKYMIYHTDNRRGLIEFNKKKQDRKERAISKSNKALENYNEFE
jgi:hypothetical protein